jgi:CRP/FNR family nitrogen fixation transcriptional regulator
MQANLVLRPPANARSFFGQSDDEVKLIGVTKTYGRDQQIYGEGEPADLVYKVVSGAIRCFRVLADGRRQISEFYLPGDIFGVEAGLERRSSAEAVGDTILVVTRRSTLMIEDENQGAKFWRLAIAELQRSREHVLTLGRRAAGERVASFLTDLAERTGAHDEVELPMSRQDMADYLGLTIETVSRTLTQLQSQGLIEISSCRHVRLKAPEALDDMRQ